jgi:hypothetical protein
LSSRELNTNLVTGIDALLNAGAYDFTRAEKEPLFMQAINEAYTFHFAHCPAYRRYCQRRGFSSDTVFGNVGEIPFLPIHAFKDDSGALVSVPQKDIVRTLRSSATSGVPSVVALDSVTARRQVKALVSVASAVLGPRRMDFLVMDVDPRSSFGAAMGARSAAVLGFLNLAKRVEYLLEDAGNGELAFPEEKFAGLIEKQVRDNQPVVIFGFTYVIYMKVAPLIAAKRRFHLPPNSKLLHIGGWKKLQDANIDRDAFTGQLAELLGIASDDVVDFYGFTEQMGITYPDGPGGLKYAPAFAEVIVRDPDTYEVLPDGKTGLLEFITPIPHSYPGIALLTDDLGVIVGRDNSIRHGTQFRILGRAGKAEARGCGDIMGEKIAARSTSTAPVSAPTAIRLLFDGSRAQQAETTLSDGELDATADSVLCARARMDAYSVDEIMTLIDAAAGRWEKDPRLAGFLQQGLLFLRNWCRPAALRETIRRSIRHPRGVLDSFMPVGECALLRAVPRGLVVHWVAGNAPLLGMLALIQSMVARNANILKAPGTFTSTMPAMLEAFRDLQVSTPSGRVLSGDDIAASTAVVYFDRTNTEASEILSRRADVRIAWGGREAVEAIVNLPKKHTVEDLVFGPKLSYMAIGREFLETSRDAVRLARNAATDVSVFDQYACASPHTIFVENGGLVSPKQFAALLAEEMERASQRIPKGPVDAATAMAIARQRLKYEFEGELWTSKGTEWTVLYDTDAGKGLAPPCYSRVVTVRAVDDILTASECASSGIQAVGLALKGARRLTFAGRAARLGVERLPEIGRMTFFDEPWDGLFPMDRLIRWVSLGGPNQ